MDTLKHLLDNVCRHNSDYHYEKLDELGEIYQKGDLFPIALIEHNNGGNIYYIRFRLGLQANKIAKLSSALSLSLQAFIFEDDFFIHEEYGYLYGDDARKAFIERIQSNAKKNKEKSKDFDRVIYVSTEPIFTYGDITFGKTKIENFWEDDDGIL